MPLENNFVYDSADTSVSLPRLQLGHITSWYLASVLRTFAQICPSVKLQIHANR